MAIINGNDASNQLNGTNLADQIFGRGGNDALEGLDGDDLLEGGAGIDDQYGGNGFDYASYRSSGAGVRVYLNLGYGLDGDAQGDGLYDIEGVIGSAHADILFGKDDRNVLRGEGGNDTLFGLGGDDELEGGAGADELFGDNGFDYASYRSSAAGVFVVLFDASGGSGDAEGDRLFSIEGLIGSAFTDVLARKRRAQRPPGRGRDDFLVGNGGDDLLDGGGGTTFCDGGAGADELRGGPGTDLAVYSNVATPAIRIDLAAGTAFGGEAEGDRLFSIENVSGIRRQRPDLAAMLRPISLGGRAGADMLSGGAAPTASSTSRSFDSTVAAPDRILDFSRGQGDKIGRRHDGRQRAGRRQTKHSSSSARMPSLAPGQLRWYQQNGDTIVEANTTDATAGAELRIGLDPLINLQASDFIFADIAFGPPN